MHSISEFTGRSGVISLLMTERELHGFYSHAHESRSGCVIYTTMTGEEVKVTSVYDSAKTRQAWEDSVYVGQLKAFVRPLHTGRYMPVKAPVTNDGYVMYYEQINNNK